MNNKFQQIFSFIIELEKLKSILRKTKVIGTDRYENSAEHSWQVCMLAQLLIDESPYDVDIVRVIEILLVHDIPEIYVGDQIVYQQKDTKFINKEREAAHKAFGLLPELQAIWCLSRWQEYEDRETNEAIFAYAVDRLMPVLLNIYNSGQSWKENKVTKEKILKVNSAIGIALPSVWVYVQSLINVVAEEHLSVS